MYWFENTILTIISYKPTQTRKTFKKNNRRNNNNNNRKRSILYISN